MKHPRIQEAEEAMDEYFVCTDSGGWPCYPGAEELLARALMLDEFNRRDGLLEKQEA